MLKRGVTDTATLGASARRRMRGGQDKELEEARSRSKIKHHTADLRHASDKYPGQLSELVASSN